MSIRPVQAADCTLLSQMIGQSIRHFHPTTFSPEKTEVWIRDYTPDRIWQRLKAGCALFCHEVNGCYSGMIGLRDNEIIGLYVAPQASGGGIGRQLIQFIESYALRQKMEQVELTSNFTTLGFYKRLGYRPQGIAYIEVEGYRYREMRLVKKLG